VIRFATVNDPDPITDPISASWSRIAGSHTISGFDYFVSWKIRNTPRVPSALLWPRRGWNSCLCLPTPICWNVVISFETVCVELCAQPTFVVQLSSANEPAGRDWGAALSVVVCNGLEQVACMEVDVADCSTLSATDKRRRREKKTDSGRTGSWTLYIATDAQTGPNFRNLKEAEKVPREPGVKVGWNAVPRPAISVIWRSQAS